MVGIEIEEEEEDRAGDASCWAVETVRRNGGRRVGYAQVDPETPAP